MARPPRSRASGPGIGFQLGSIVVLLAIVAFAVWVASAMRSEEGAAAQAPAEERPDPFEGLEPEAPPVRKGGGAAASLAAVGEGADPFATLEKPTDAQIWQDALELAEEAEVLIQEAEVARDAGVGDLARAKGKQAQELLDQAIESTRAWEEQLSRERGFADPQVKQVVGRRSSWVRKVMALKKNASI